MGTQPSLRDFVGGVGVFPALKRWANIGSSLRDESPASPGTTSTYG